MKLVGEGFSRNGHLSLKGIVKSLHDDGSPTSFVERVDLYDRKGKLALVEHLVDDLTWSLDEARDKVNALVIKVEEELLGAQELPDDDGTKDSQATLLVDLADGAELWHTPEGDCFATIDVGGHRETWGLRTRSFREWLSYQFYQQQGKSPGGQAVADALSVLSGKALFESPEYVVYTRVAEVDGAIFLDFANDEWEVVEVTAHGWRVTNTFPVRFRRARGMLPLPIPVSGGDIGLLRQLLNLASDDDWALFVGCLIQALRGRGPYPVLIIHGEHGSAKSTASRAFRKLIDPNRSDLRSPPRDERDLRIQATNGWIVGYDNLSWLPEWLSNALCRLATGGGMGTRELYTDDEEKIFDGQRPCVLNGIEDVATRPDLVDRSVILELPSITEEARVTEIQFWGRFDAAHPSILGGLLDAVVSGLRRASEVHLDRLPRMADFALWVTAAEPGLGLTPGSFMKAYRENRKIANDAAIDAQIIGPSIIKLMEGRPTWTGTATELLAKLKEITDETVTKSKGWPTRANVLSGKIRVLAPNLRAARIDVARGEGQNRRKITLTRREGDLGNEANEDSPHRKNGLGNHRHDRHTVTPSGANGDDGGGDDDEFATDSNTTEEIDTSACTVCRRPVHPGHNGDDRVYLANGGVRHRECKTG